jgi:IPT/TIG domain
MRKVLVIFLLLAMCLGLMAFMAVGTAVGQPAEPDTVTAATPIYYRVFQESYLKSLPLSGGYFSCLKAQPPYTFFHQDWYGVKLADLLDQEVGLLDGTAGIKVIAKDGYSKTFNIDTDIRPANSQGLYTILAWQKGVQDAAHLEPPLTALDNIEGPFRLVPPQHPNVGTYDEGGSFNWNLSVQMVRAIEVQPLPAGVTPVDLTTIPDNEIVVYGNIHPYAIESISPTSGPSGTEVTISGYGFGSIKGTSYVAFGAVQATDYVSWGSKEIKCKVPAGIIPGTVDVSVTTSVEGATNGVPFTVTGVPPTLSLTSISPASGINWWPISVTLTGTGFQAAATARLEKAGSPTIDATDLAVVSDTQITCNFNVAWVSLGKYDVVVKNPDDQEAKLPAALSVTDLCGQGAGMVFGFGIALGIFSIAGISLRGRRRRRAKK